MDRIYWAASDPGFPLTPALLKECLDPETEFFIHDGAAAPDAQPLPWEPTVVVSSFPAPAADAVVWYTPLQARFPGVVHIALCRDAIGAAAASAAGADAALTPDDCTPVRLHHKLAAILQQRSSFRSPEEDFYYRLFNDSPQPMWLFDRESLRFLLVNRAAERVYGYSRQDFLDRLTVLDLRDPSEHDRFREALRTGPSHDDYYSGIWQHQRRDGSRFFVRIYSQEGQYRGHKCHLIMAVDVDEQHRIAAENTRLNQKMLDQAERTASLLNSLHDLVWSVDARTGALLYINHACAAMLGYDAEALVQGRWNFAEFVHPYDRARLADSTAALLKHRALQAQFRVLARDGSVLHLRCHITLTLDAGGTALLINGVGNDITAQYQAEIARQRTADELRTVLESVTDGFITLDTEWNFTYVNREFERVCKLKREEVLGRNYWDVFPKANDLQFFTEYHRAVRDRVSVHFEEYATSFNAWISVTAYPTDTGLTVYFQDVTTERLLRDRIRRDEENLKALIDNTDDLIWSVDADFRLISCNSAFLRLFAEKAQHEITIGDSMLLQSYTPERRAQWESYYSRGLQGETFDVFDTMTLAGGTFRHNEMRFRPITVDVNTIVGVSCYCRDVTLQRGRQLAIEKQNEQLRQIAWVQNHDVRGPLASILGCVSVLNLAGIATSEAHQELLRGLQDAAERLDRVIHNIDGMTRTVEAI